jgi:hypothetical protein
MADGPGKYDFFCTMVRQRTRARGVILIVLDGHLGNGMSAQIDGAIVDQVPALLEQVARDIREGRQ